MSWSRVMMDNTSVEHKPTGSIGWGVFLLLAGVVLLTEKLGWLPNGADWLLPVILIAWGASELYRHLRPSA
jgi:hypothetical protein